MDVVFSLYKVPQPGYNSFWAVCEKTTREKKCETIFFLQHLQVFFLKAKLISTSPSFLHKKMLYYAYAKYFFKKRDTKGFVPKNKSVSRGKAERRHNTSDTQFSSSPKIIHGHRMKYWLKSNTHTHKHSE